MFDSFQVREHWYIGPTADNVCSNHNYNNNNNYYYYYYYIIIIIIIIIITQIKLVSHTQAVQRKRHFLKFFPDFRVLMSGSFNQFWPALETIT